MVQQTASVPTFFIKAIGIDTIPIAATSTASASGGAPKPLNVEIVLDATTALMSFPT